MALTVAFVCTLGDRYTVHTRPDGCVGARIHYVKRVGLSACMRGNERRRESERERENDVGNDGAV